MQGIMDTKETEWITDRLLLKPILGAPDSYPYRGTLIMAFVIF